MKLRFAKYICSVMAWLHGNDKLHLRLKPTNILFTKEWKIKVTDYGLQLPQVSKIPDGWIDSGHAYYYPPELLSDKSQVSNAVDVYSFGLVLYSLLVEEFPYYEAKSIEELLTSIEENPVSLDEKIYPPSIIELLKKCLSKKVDERPTFEYLSNDTTWTKIYQDMVSVGLECGKVIWDRAAEESKLPTTTTSIPWDVFSKVLWQVLEINYEDTEKDKARQKEVEECVETMLYLKDGKMVDFNNWGRFLTWFAPLRIGKDGKEFINRVVELLKAPWFYGREFNRTMSDGLINKILNDKKIMAENKGKYPFLVRIAESQQERFCLVYYNVATKIITHVPLSPNDFVEMGIYKYISDMAKKKNWFPTKEERPYQREIFDKIQKLESKDMTKDKSNQVRSVIQPNSIVGKTKYI